MFFQPASFFSLCCVTPHVFHVPEVLWVPSVGATVGAGGGGIWYGARGTGGATAAPPPGNAAKADTRLPGSPASPGGQEVRPVALDILLALAALGLSICGSWSCSHESTELLRRNWAPIGGAGSPSNEPIFSTGYPFSFTGPRGIGGLPLGSW